MVESQVVQVTPTSGPSCEERAQVERLLADPLFSQSKRCGSFLRHVTERALRGAHDPVTERALGIEIFGRPANYDTDADPIVRVTASEVRKRLSQYYEDRAHAGEIRVFVHKGSYVAEFLSAPTQPPAENVSAPPVAPVADFSKKPWYVVHRWYIAVALAAGSVAISALALLPIRHSSVAELFWAPITNSPRDVLLSVPQFSDHVKLEGVEQPRLTWTDPLTPTPDTMEATWDHYAKSLVHTWDLSVACRLSEFLGSRRKHVLVRGEHDLTMRDLRESPAVVLGGLNNQWTSRLLPQARFYFDGEGTERFIRDRQNPSDRRWKFDAKVPTSIRDRDFIIISRVADSASGRITVLAGGFSAWGTEAAAALLTDADQMESVLAHAPRNWQAQNLQIVLECSVVNRQSGIPRFLAAHFW